jgi:hypothetical protein
MVTMYPIQTLPILAVRADLLMQENVAFNNALSPISHDQIRAGDRAEDLVCRGRDSADPTIVRHVMRDGCDIPRDQRDTLDTCIDVTPGMAPRDVIALMSLNGPASRQVSMDGTRAALRGDDAYVYAARKPGRVRTIFLKNYNIII